MKKNWIKGAIKKPGALHRELGVPKGKKIPAGKLAAAASKKGVVGKRARLAETLKGMKHKTKKKGELAAIANNVTGAVKGVAGAVKGDVQTIKNSMNTLGKAAKGWKPFSLSNSFDRQVAAEAKSRVKHKSHSKKMKCKTCGK